MSTYSVGPRSDTMVRHIDRSGVSAATKRTTDQVNPWILEDNPAKSLCSTVKSLATKQATRLYDNVKFMSLVANRDFLGSFNTVASPVTGMPRMSDNQLAKHVETTVGKLVQANSRVTMMTDMGDWSLWNRARKIESALKGEWARMHFYREAQKVAKDGFVSGTGVMKLCVSDDGDKVECQRVFPNEVFVDEMEAAFGEPQKMYQMRYVAKDTLAAQFPDKYDIIMSAPVAMPPRFAWCLYSQGMIEVVEGWALPIGDRPGRHVIAVGDGCLVDEEWDEDCFPFVHFKPVDAPFGWYGQGWVEQTMGAQILLNQILNLMEEGVHYGISPFWVVAEGAKINMKHLDNVVGHIVETAGPAPTWVTNKPFHEAAPAYAGMLRSVISDYWGNNQMDTGGEVELNRIDSKKALREYQSLGQARITTVLERWSNDFYLDAAERTLMLAGRIAKAKGAYPVLVKDTYKKAVQLDWKDLDMKRDSYLLTPAPANMLSNTPAGKTDDIKELMQSGIITQKQAQRAMQGPDDINALLAEASATEDDFDWIIEQFVEKKTYIAPSSIQDLQRGLVRMSDAYLQYRTLELPEENLDLFLQWLEDAQDIMQDQQAQHAPAPMVAMPGGGMPGAPPSPPPGAMSNAGIPSAPAGNPSTGNLPPTVTGQPALGALPGQ